MELTTIHMYVVGHVKVKMSFKFTVRGFLQNICRID